MVDAADSKSAFKHRWRARIFSKDDDAPPKDPKPKTQTSFKLDDDVNAFLKPSTDRAQAHKAAAAQALLSATKPRIDVSAAQRWPKASDVVNSAAARNPGVGGLKTGLPRMQGLAVSFVRTQPIIIGEGGDECETPSIDVYKRKMANSRTEVDRLGGQTHRDDLDLGTHSSRFDSSQSANQEAARRGIVTRTRTSAGEISPPLHQRLQMGNINTHVSPPPPLPQHLGQMGLGERPKQLTRAPTGFDTMASNDPRRPSMDSAYSYESEMSPAGSMKVPDLPVTREEHVDFVPKPLKRTQTGWSEQNMEPENGHPPAAPAIPRLPQTGPVDEDSPLDGKAILAECYVQREPSNPSSFSSRLTHRMGAEEGRALHEAAQRASLGRQDSDSSTSSTRPYPAAPNASQIRTPPPASSRQPTPAPAPAPALLSHLPSHEPSPPASFAQPGLEAGDPQRSRARGPSPGRRPMPPGTEPLNTDPKLPPSPNVHASFSTASRPGFSPPVPSQPFPALSTAPHAQPPVVQTQFATSANQPSSAVSQSSVLPTPSQYERPAFAPPPVDPQPPAASSHWPDQSPAVPTIQGQPIPRQRTDVAPTEPLGRSDTTSQADAAYVDFGRRIEHMRGVFQLMAQLNGQVYSHSPFQWLRVAAWWFLKGRAGMEAAIRNRPRTAEPQPERLTQPHVDLAKTWWILEDVLLNHPMLNGFGKHQFGVSARLAREAGNALVADVYEAYDATLGPLKLLLGSVKRHQSMPPTQALIQGQHQEVWEKYPAFAPDLASVLSGTAMRAHAANGQPPDFPTIPVSDTRDDFCYFRMFVTLSISTDDPSTDRVPLPAILSVLRSREDFRLKLVISGQTDLVNIVIGASPETAPTWNDVHWKSKAQGLSVELRHGFMLNVDLAETDFRMLWSIVDHTNRVESHLHERADEQVACKLTLREAAYKDPANLSAFPQERIRGCKLFVFEKFDTSSEGTGKRKLHRGYRVVLVTHPRNRTVGFVSHELGTTQEPMNFAYTTEPDQSPGMTLHFREGNADKKPRSCAMQLAFHDGKDRNHVFGLLTSMNVGHNEMVFAQVPLKGFSIESADPAEGFSQSGRDVLQKLRWIEAKTMNQDPVAAGLESAPTVMSESLRILCRHGAGVISDRMNLGPGDLLVRLPIDGAAELTLLRTPQQDMAVAIDGSRSDEGIPDALAELLRTLTSASTIRRLAFNSFKDLHAFQLAVTGFQVKFDGIATSFSIARRRMVVPIYKQWTANTVRIQLVQQDNIIQLLAFFEEFPHADAMNFQLKTMDVFEKTDKGGNPSLRLVDCKFALPVEERRGEGKMGKEEGKLTGWAGMKRRFVCLDQIEYPGEHDDVVIAFESAETRDVFAQALPSAVVERKFTIRRKI